MRLTSKTMPKKNPTIKKRDITPQPQHQKQDQKDSTSRLDLSLNMTPLRSNIKKHSNDAILTALKIPKKVVIQDPSLNYNIKSLLYTIQEFLIKKIINCQQEGFDSIAKPFIRQVQIEQQIHDNHDQLCVRNVFQKWARGYESQRKSKSQQNHTTQRIRLQDQISPREKLENTLNEKIMNYHNKHIKLSIFNVMKKNYKEKQQNGILNFEQQVVFKSTAIQENLSKFLQDMNHVVKDVKVWTKHDESLKEAIQLNKKQLSKKDYSKLKISQSKSGLKNKQQSNFLTQPTPYKTPVRLSTGTQKSSKTQTSFRKDSQQNITSKSTERVSRILFQDNSNLAPQISQREKSLEKIAQIRKNQSAQKFSLGASDLSQPKRLASNPNILKLQSNQNGHKKNLSERSIKKNTIDSQQNVLKFVDKLNSMITNKRIELFNIYKKDIEHENSYIHLSEVNLKRKIIFSWNQILPELQVEKFQLKFKLQKLVKAIKHPFFNILKQRKKEQLKVVERISEFLHDKHQKGK